MQLFTGNKLAMMNGWLLFGCTAAVVIFVVVGGWLGWKAGGAIWYPISPVVDRNSPKPKRRWRQFSMRTLLVFVVVLSVGFGLVGVRIQRARTNRARLEAVKELVAKIEQLGGVCYLRQHRVRPQTYIEKLFSDPGPIPIPVVTVVNFGNPAGQSCRR